VKAQKKKRLLILHIVSWSPAIITTIALGSRDAFGASDAWDHRCFIAHAPKSTVNYCVNYGFLLLILLVNIIFFVALRSRISYYEKSLKTEVQNTILAYLMVFIISWVFYVIMAVVAVFALEQYKTASDGLNFVALQFGVLQGLGNAIVYCLLNERIRRGYQSCCSGAIAYEKV